MADEIKKHEIEIEKAELILKNKELEFYDYVLKNHPKKTGLRSPSFLVSILLLAVAVFLGDMYRTELIDNNKATITQLKEAHQKELFALQKKQKVEIDSYKSQIEMLKKTAGSEISILKSSSSESKVTIQRALDSAMEQNKQLSKTNEYLKYIIAGLTSDEKK